MRTLSSTLAASQKKTPHIPSVKVEIHDQRAGVPRLKWTRHYTGAEDDSFHAVCMPADGSLIRMRVDSSNNIYWQRVTSPGSGSTYSSWTDWAINGYAVSISASGTAVRAFAIQTDGKLYYCDSSDSGATWGSWMLLKDISGDATFTLASCHKSATEGVVLYSDATDVFHILWGQTAQWLSPTSYDDSPSQWVNETNAYDENTGTFATATPIAPGWCYRLELNHANLRCDQIRFFDDTHNNANITKIDLDVYDSNAAAWIDVYEGTFNEDAAWNVKALDQERSITKMRVLFFNAHATDDASARLYEADFRSTWGTVAQWSLSMASITGLAVVYGADSGDQDYNVVLTGTRAGTSKPIVVATILGDGDAQAANTWAALMEMHTLSAGANIAFKFPSLTEASVFRCCFVEDSDDSEAYSYPYWSHMTPAAQFEDNLWKEPAPFNLSSDFGLALANDGTTVWATAPYGVWAATLAAASVAVTTKVLKAVTTLSESHGELTLHLDNSKGTFNNMGVADDTYEVITKGAEIQFSPGYKTTDGSSPEHSTGLRFWIVARRLRALRGGTAGLELFAVDGWGLLDRVKVRGQIRFAADTTITNIARFILARVGLDIAIDSASTAIDAQSPEFVIYPGQTMKDAMLGLLSRVEDVMYFRGATGHLLHPQANDSSDYTYTFPGSDSVHRLLEGHYGDREKLSRVMVTGSGDFTEDWDWDEQDLIGDVFAQVTDLNLTDTTFTGQRADAIMRDSDIHELIGGIAVKVNCGQELYDVVTLTDPRAGKSAVLYRVLGISHRFALGEGAVYEMSIALGAR